MERKPSSPISSVVYNFAEYDLHEKRKNPITCQVFSLFKHTGHKQSYELERPALRSVTTFHTRQLLCFNNNRYDVQVESGIRYLGDGRLIGTAARAV